MRREDNFLELIEEKNIVIPIIQRDYAQGREDPKALSVRTRLIEEWIDILNNQDLRMDFNYIYGNEGADIFYPVDGQQRLTSLYLLHWYLAMATENTSEIGKWNFDYKTRNSASEFFKFLRNVGKSQVLYEILHSENDEETKKAHIKNESWFKTKWEHDPTIMSCVNFLCMLSGKLSDYEERFESFWERLHDTAHPAVYFTCLKEHDDKYAEIDAAKKYTRMNARGKRLTNFENLKAMIDEIEMKHISRLRYCSDDEDYQNTISWTYDRNYIDCMFKSMQEDTLIEKTKSINDESEKWFRLVYYVYALVNGRGIPSDLVLSQGNIGESYEDVIYKVSQGRVKEDRIVEYLYMLKAVLEVLCNSGKKLAYRYHDFSLNILDTKIDAMAFILLVTKLWNKNNNKEDNRELIEKWNQFRNALRDLEIYRWKVSDDEEKADRGIAQILYKMVDGIFGTSQKSVDEYFVVNDFVTNSPFTSFELLSDLKCRVLERKIKSKLICDGAIVEEDVDKVSVGTRRLGYLYYICGYLKDWELGDWSEKEKWDGSTINSYIEFMKNQESFEKQMTAREAKVVFTYASQYDFAKSSLLSADDIAACNNEHIWNYDFLVWNDEEYDEIVEEKMKLLDHLKVMFDLLIDYKNSSRITDEELFEKYVETINTFFENSSGYEKCWLRFAAKYPVGGKELLDSKLENENGIVKIKSVPVILRTYLVENGYSYVEKVKKIKGFHKKSNFFSGDETKVLYADTDKTCTFAPDADNSGKYQHSQKTSWGWDLSGNTVNRNMDLFYRAYLDLSGIGMALKNNFWSIDIDGDVYSIKIYEIIGIKSGELTVQISEAAMDTDLITQMEKNISQWKNRFDMIEKEPKTTGKYDHWIELWNDEYQEAFGSSFVQGAVRYDKSGGQRPRKVWSEVTTVPKVNWIVRTVDI